MNIHAGMTQYQIDEQRHQERMKALRTISGLLGTIVVFIAIFFLILILGLGGQL